MIDVEVAYATPTKQLIIATKVLPNATLEDAVIASGILTKCKEINWPNVNVGIFGRVVAKKTRLAAYDRIEIYRPLHQDPKEARRKRTQR